MLRLNRINLRFVPTREDVKAMILICRPAQAGTHTPQRGDGAGPGATETLVVMGPRLRADDTGWVCAEDS
jgi:hypothetical protein